MDRKLHCTLLWLLCISLFQIVPSQAQNVDSATAFVRQVDADYANPDWRHQQNRQDKFYTRQMYRLIAADRTGHTGEVGNLDWDPICSCQDPGDPGDLKVQSITLSPTGPFTFKAVVAFVIVREPVITVTLTLLKTPSGWRIDDISEKETTSLRALLLTRPASEHRAPK